MQVIVTTRIYKFSEIFGIINYNMETHNINGMPTHIQTYINTHLVEFPVWHGNLLAIFGQRYVSRCFTSHWEMTASRTLVVKHVHRHAHLNVSKKSNDMKVKIKNIHVSLEWDISISVSLHRHLRFMHFSENSILEDLFSDGIEFHENNYVVTILRL